METRFQQSVFRVVRKIPRGKTLSYKEVAERAGFPKASRAVGNILAMNSDTSVPCHRVIRSDGKLGAYNGLLGKSKEKILREEGAL
jgi:O-6-methylguanine DNA methyltransferase